MLVNNPKKIAYQSPRVGGNAVYQARAMLGLIILDTETYSAKSSSISIEIIDKIKLYPNPASEVLNYEFELEHPEKGNVKIYSILGQTLKEFSVNHKLSSGTVDISSFSKGVYLFELCIDGKQKITKQFVVN